MWWDLKDSKRDRGEWRGEESEGKGGKGKGKGTGDGDGDSNGDGGRESRERKTRSEKMQRMPSSVGREPSRNGNAGPHVNRFGPPVCCRKLGLAACCTQAGERE